MCRVRSTPRVLILIATVLLGFSGTAFGQIPAITSNGSLGAISWWDGYYTVILNTDAMSIDVSTFHGGYSVGGGCPWGTYSPDPALNRCARLVPQSGGPDIVVYDFTTVSIGQNNVYVAGSRPAAIAATGTITIAGAITMNNATRAGRAGYLSGGLDAVPGTWARTGGRAEPAEATWAPTLSRAGAVARAAVPRLEPGRQQPDAGRCQRPVDVPEAPGHNGGRRPAASR
jgi:hypothetical protein